MKGSYLMPIKLIAFEGIDGTGKTTAIQSQLDYLDGDYRFVVDTIRFPYNYDEIKQKHKEMLASNTSTKEITDMFIEDYLVGCGELLKKHKEMLAQDEKTLVVFSDRSFISTLVYQQDTDYIFTKLKEAFLDDRFIPIDLANLFIPFTKSFLSKTMQKSIGGDVFDNQTKEEKIKLIAKYIEINNLFATSTDLQSLVKGSHISFLDDYEPHYPNIQDVVPKHHVSEYLYNEINQYLPKGQDCLSKQEQRALLIRDKQKIKQAHSVFYCPIFLQSQNNGSFKIKTLAVSRKNDHKDLGLIGGKREINEDLMQAVRREAREETQLASLNNMKLELPIVNLDYNNVFYDDGITIFVDIVTDGLLKKDLMYFHERVNQENALLKIVNLKELTEDQNSFSEYNVKLYKYAKALIYQNIK